MVIKMSKPTKEDAALLLQLMAVTIAKEENKKAMLWVYFEFHEKNYDNFKTKYPMGSEGFNNIMTVANDGELVGVLVNNELLSEDLVFDLYGSLLWEKLEPIIQGMRKDANKPRLFENYEVCAKKYQIWEEKNPPKV